MTPLQRFARKVIFSTLVYTLISPLADYFLFHEDINIFKRLIEGLIFGLIMTFMFKPTLNVLDK